ncbi:CoA ester lyase [Leeia sp.]|uniref:HpcH/HpaI aldolase/citrate lyase family protein n=1 Tax=Leeia sp. TaxID=2884678 RepID=UPI0035ADFCF8
MSRAVRSWLFAPGHHARRVEKALTLNADVVVLDLEDACTPEDKPVARTRIMESLSLPRTGRLFARINSMASPYVWADLQAVIRPGLDGVMLPKIESGQELKTLDWTLQQLERERGLPVGGLEVMPLVETATGLMALEEIAQASRRVRRLAFGAGDLTLDLSLQWTPEELELLPYRSRMALVSRAAGLEAPIDTVWMQVGDEAGMEASARRAHGLGFQGKLCIHPNQVACVHRAFAPTEAEVQRARQIVAAFAASDGACVLLDGQLVELPVVERAQRILAVAEAVVGR